MYRNMKNWVAEQIAAPVKKPLPLLSFPCIRLLGVSVQELISDSTLQARGMKAVEDRVPSAAAVSLMDLSVEAECFGSTVHFSEGEVPTVVGAVVSDEDEADALNIPEVGAARSGIYVDAVVIGSEEDNMQCISMPYDGAAAGEFTVPLDAIPTIPLNQRKVVARRAAMELPNDAIVNLGTGMPEQIANVCAEEGISDKMTLTVEAGPIGGIPLAGPQFGACANAEAILDHNVQFDFYQGGGLDIAFLGLAETAPNGDLNVSKFGTRLAGSGGFVDITQNAKKVCYCGTFTAKGLKVEVADGKIKILQEGEKKKFVKEVEHITFSGTYANKVKQPVLYITERAVFELRPEGVTLIEIAPGIDLQTQILDQMEFMPKIADDLKLMDERIFRDEPMGLAEKY